MNRKYPLANPIYFRSATLILPLSSPTLDTLSPVSLTHFASIILSTTVLLACSLNKCLEQLSRNMNVGLRLFAFCIAHPFDVAL